MPVLLIGTKIDDFGPLDDLL